MREKRKSCSVKAVETTLILFIVDLLGVFLSLSLSLLLVNFVDQGFQFTAHEALAPFSEFLIFYIVIHFVFFSEGIYTYRFDFWHELRLIYRSLMLSLVVILAYLAITHEVAEYSRSVILVSFVFMALIIPYFKSVTKHRLFKMGLWKLGVKVLNDDPHLEAKIFNNPYLGYIKSIREQAAIVFINSHKSDFQSVRDELEKEISSKNKVMFVPVMDNYQFSGSDIFELDKDRTSLIVLSNKLNSSNRRFVNITYNYILAILLIPVLMPIIAIIAYLVKVDSSGPVFFIQDRLGLDGEIFRVFKFRTMYINGNEILEEYLIENPQEVENYRIYCKYENDPRITKIGHFLRKTSLDELAQIINVLKGEMNFVGPRPYLVGEKEKIGHTNAEIILKTKPGITGLWQVSGRNGLTFDERVELDKWYIYNWSLWNDFVILVKTISVVLKRSGAK